MTKQLTIEKSNALKAYKGADAKIKSLLEGLFGKDIFKENIMERVKTFEDVLEEYGEVPPNLQILLDYNGIDKDLLAPQAFLKISMMRKVLNEGWEPDWADNSQRKYSPWFNMNSGSGVSCNDFGCDFTCSRVGSRLVFKSEELAVYAGKQFVSLYELMLTL